MMALKYIRLISIFASFAFFAVSSDLFAQEKLTVSYSSVDAPSANWYIAQEKGFYKKYGMDVESIFIPASSTNVAVLVAGQIKFGNGTGGVIASAAVSGANLVAVACFVNTLPYELIVQESIKSKESSKAKVSASAASAALPMSPQEFCSKVWAWNPTKTCRSFKSAARASAPRHSARERSRRFQRRRGSSIWRKACPIAFSPAPRIFPNPIRFPTSARRRQSLIWRVTGRR